MSIITSSYILAGPVQADGSQGVVETHTDHLGVTHKRAWRALAGLSKTSVLAEQAVLLAERLADEEFELLLLTPGVVAVQHQTDAQFVKRLRERFRTATREDCARLAAWFLDHLDNGSFTEAQARSAFGLTIPNWDTLKSRLTALRTNWNAVQAASGE